MNRARWEKFVEAYAVALVDAINAHPGAYHLSTHETVEDKALRIALNTSGLIERHGAAMLILEAPGVRHACEALKIPNTSEGLQAYFDGGE